MINKAKGAVKWCLPLFFFTFLPLTLAAQDKVSEFNAVEHAVISQTIAPDARSAGMGDVGAATDPDVNSQYWNPAKYPFCISRAGISLNYTPGCASSSATSTWPTWPATTALATTQPSAAPYATSP